LLQGSGIDLDIIRERGYRTCSGYSELKSLGIQVRRDTHTQGLLLPVHSVDGKPAMHFIAREDRAVPLMIYRPDRPEIDQDGRPRKYLYPASATMRLDCPPRCQPDLSDPGKPLWITEGLKKVDALASRGATVIGLHGVWCWRGQNAKGGKVALPDWQGVALNNREVRIVFDSDVMEKASVDAALQALTGFLQSKDARVHVAYLPSINGQKVGVDDYLLTQTLQELEGLLQAPRKRTKQRQSTLRFLMTEKETPRLILYNAMLVFEVDRRWDGVLRYNEFSGKVELHAPPPPFADDPHWHVQPLQEHHESEIARWIQMTHGFYAQTKLISEALVTMARRDCYHPVQEYLRSLTWDGTARLDALFIRYCHAEDTAYTRAIGAKTMIAAVARIMEPGCKADTMPILCGKQGLLKSTLWETLATKEWFTDALPDLHNKDAAMALRGKWIVEMADLDNFARSETETIKRFLSANQDHYRAPYDRHASTIPRSSVFVGTTNKDIFLRDETGNRRFWPVAVQGPCDIEALRQDRDQLWAEALSRYIQGEAWHLNGDVAQQAEEEQRARVEPDSWTEPVLEYLQRTPRDYGLCKGRRVPFVKTNELLEKALGLDKVYWTSGNTRRVANLLRFNGWRHDRVENPRKGEGEPRQLRVFIYEPDEPDTENPSDSSSPPHKTSSETNETDETDHRYTRENAEQKKERREEEEGSRKFTESTVSAVSAVSKPATTTASTVYNETDNNTIGLNVGLNGSASVSSPPEDILPCAVCGKANRWEDAGVSRCRFCYPPPASSTDGKPRMPKQPSRRVK
jgi:predicted P-loop ATPase